MVCAVLRRYEPFLPFPNWTYKPNSHDSIYTKMMELTDGDHEISSDAASWCELAHEGEIYEFREGEIEMQDIG